MGTIGILVVLVISLYTAYWGATFGRYKFRQWQFGWFRLTLYYLLFVPIMVSLSSVIMMDSDGVLLPLATVIYGFLLGHIWKVISPSVESLAQYNESMKRNKRARKWKKIRKTFNELAEDNEAAHAIQSEFQRRMGNMGVRPSRNINDIDGEVVNDKQDNKALEALNKLMSTFKKDKD